MGPKRTPWVFQIFTKQKHLTKRDTFSWKSSNLGLSQGCIHLRPWPKTKCRHGKSAMVAWGHLRWGSDLVQGIACSVKSILKCSPTSDFWDWQYSKDQSLNVGGRKTISTTSSGILAIPWPRGGDEHGIGTCSLFVQSLFLNNTKATKHYWSQKYLLSSYSLRAVQDD